MVTVVLANCQKQATPDTLLLSRAHDKLQLMQKSVSLVQLGRQQRQVLPGLPDEFQWGSTEPALISSSRAQAWLGVSNKEKSQDLSATRTFPKLQSEDEWERDYPRDDNETAPVVDYSHGEDRSNENDRRRKDMEQDEKDRLAAEKARREGDEEAARTAERTATERRQQRIQQAADALKKAQRDHDNAVKAEREASEHKEHHKQSYEEQRAAADKLGDALEKERQSLSQAAGRKSLLVNETHDFAKALKRARQALQMANTSLTEQKSEVREAADAFTAGNQTASRAREDFIVSEEQHTRASSQLEEASKRLHDAEEALSHAERSGTATRHARWATMCSGFLVSLLLLDLAW